MEGVPGGGRLSEREVSILSEAANGVPTRQIAAEYGLSVHTVRTHFKHILAKLGARTRAQAVAIAYSEGLIARDLESSRRLPEGQPDR